jgi:hypothetical protein
MTSQTDKLFRDKLENLQRTAPEAAWEKIETGLDKTKNKFRWMKIAAGLLLLSVGTFILWPKTISENPELSVIKNTVIPKVASPQKKNAEVISPSTSTQQRVKQKSITPKNTSTKESNPALVAELTQPEKTNLNTSLNESIEEATTIQVASIETNSTQESSSKKIVYTADEVNAKYLRKKLPTEATPEAKKTSGIQKLMGLAYNLKNTDNGLGDLRQKKDEILALNFLNEDKTNKSKN